MKLHPSISDLAVSCSQDRCIKLWSLKDGNCKQSVKLGSSPLDVAFTSDGNRIVSCHHNGSLHVHDLRTGWTAMDPMVHVGEIAGVHEKLKNPSGACVGVVASKEKNSALSVGRDSSICVTDLGKREVRVGGRFNSVWTSRENYTVVHPSW